MTMMMIMMMKLALQKLPQNENRTEKTRLYFGQTWPKGFVVVVVVVAVIGHLLCDVLSALVFSHCSMSVLAKLMIGVFCGRKVMA